MRKYWLKTVVFSAAIILSACSAQENAKEENGPLTVNAEEGNHDHHQKNGTTVYDKSVSKRNLDDGLIIPSENGEKRQTTDEHGGTTHGAGTNVYSLIGSSGLHEGGISAHLESRLGGEGITGVKVFVIDDTVILARATPGVTSNQYDSMQKEILTGPDGMTNKDQNSDTRNMGKTEETDDSLEKAKSYINKAFNGNVQTLTVTNPKAVELIEKIKKNLFVDKVPYETVSNDIVSLIKMTKEK